MAYATYLLRVTDVQLVTDPNNAPKQMARMKLREISNVPPTPEGGTSPADFPQCTVHLLIEPERALRIGESVEAKFAIFLYPAIEPHPPPPNSTT